MMIELCTEVVSRGGRVAPSTRHRVVNRRCGCGRVGRPATGGLGAAGGPPGGGVGFTVEGGVGVGRGLKPPAPRAPPGRVPVPAVPAPAPAIPVPGPVPVPAPAVPVPAAPLAPSISPSPSGASVAASVRSFPTRPLGCVSASIRSTFATCAALSLSPSITPLSFAPYRRSSPTSGGGASTLAAVAASSSRHSRRYSTSSSNTARSSASISLSGAATLSTSNAFMLRS